MNLLIVEERDLSPEREFTVGGEHAEHIFCILRAKPGDVIRAGILGGGIGTARVLESTRHSARLKLEDTSNPPPAPSNILPVIALPRPQSFKKTLHFIASSGIRRAVFFHAAKTEKSYWTSSCMAPDAIRSVLIEGLEQGCTTILPELTFVRSLREFFGSGLSAQLTDGATAIIGHPVDAAPCPVALPGKVVLAIGPEGGFTPDEVAAFRANGYAPVTFGPHILRVEFALSFLAGRLAFMEPDA
ncbi:MAG: 16S rRNA (uracil(1498)-N(3))-methyltransferase [Lentisphaeria bacterium]|nr:16S rRNA (uracil(1498)-N(3))-methyltransferase [Lentisphaeria bacterium]